MQPPNPHQEFGSILVARLGTLQRLWPWFDFGDAATPEAQSRRFRPFVILAAIAIGLSLIQTFLSNSLITPATPRGIVDLELAFLPANARDILRQWAGDGRMSLRLALVGLLVDSVYVYFYVPVLFSVCRWIKQNIDGPGPQNRYITTLGDFGTVVAAATALAGCFDWLENLFLALLLGTSWSPSGSSAWLGLAIPAALFAVGKFALIGTVCLYALVGLPQTNEAQALSKVARLVGINLLIGLGAAVLLLVPSQGQEILRVLAEDITAPKPEWGAWARALLLFVSALYLAHNSWDWALFLVHEEADKRAEIEPLGWPAVLLPRLCGVLPLVLLALALWRASFPVSASESASEMSRMVGLSVQATIALWSLSAIAGGLAILTFRLRAPIHIAKPLRRQLLGGPERAVGRGLWIVSAVALGGLLVPLSAGWFRNAGTLFLGHLGAAAVVLLGFSFFVPIASGLVWFRVHRRINAPALLLVWVFICAQCDFGDNHEVRQHPGAGTLALRMDPKGFLADLQKSAKSDAAGPFFNGEITRVDINTGAPIDPGEKLSPGTDVPLYDLNDAFTAWLSNRSDLRQWRGPGGRSAAARPYPVFFVAAEGGGIRAAYQTADLLAAIQNSHPAFARHLFTISGVSGGSLGGAVFAALTRSQIKRQIPPATFPWHMAVDNVLKHDLLTPPLAGTLSADLVQRAIPIAMPRADRARALEIALENAWETGMAETAPGLDHATKHLMRGSLNSLYTDFPSASTPALFFNSTCVQTGQRLVTTAFWPRDHLATRVIRDMPTADDGTVDLLPGISGLQCLPGITENCSLNLSTAAVLSARFPGVSSSGGLVHRRLAPFRRTKSGDPALVPVTFQRRYVDGGYYENSGVSTLNDVLTALGAYDNDWDRPHGQSGRPAWYPIIITIGFEDSERVKSASGERRTFPASVQRPAFDELSPLQTFVAIYGAHGVAAQKRIESNLVPLKQIHGEAKWLPFTFRITDAALPLGWLLSKAARDSIHRQIGRPPIQDQIDKVGTALQ